MEGAAVEGQEASPLFAGRWGRWRGGGKERGVAAPGDLVARPGDNRAGYYRAGQRAPARFVHPRHPAIALGADQLLYKYLDKGYWTALAHYCPSLRVKPSLLGKDF